MATNLPQASRHRAGQASVWVWLAVVLTVCGCRSARIHQAARVPSEFLAASTENVQTIDLSRLAATQTVSSQQIGPGDLLDVTIETGYGDQPDAAAVRVGEDGNATIPLVGSLRLAGLQPEFAERAVAAAAVQRGLYRNPTVTVDVKRQRTNRVTLVGAVEKPDVYELPRGSSSLLSAIVSAGGLSSDAGTAVEIRRPAQMQSQPPGDRVTAASYQGEGGNIHPASFHVDLVKAARGEDPTAHVLQDGDIVMVEKRDPQPFDVMGLVNRPGRFELPANKDMYLLDALAMAGGTSTQWADKTHLVRMLPGRMEPMVVQISIKKAMEEGTGNFRLMPGDVISVEKTPTTLVTGFFRAIAPYTITAVVPFIR